MALIENSCSSYISNTNIYSTRIPNFFDVVLNNRNKVKVFTTDSLRGLPILPPLALEELNEIIVNSIKSSRIRYPFTYAIIPLDKILCCNIFNSNRTNPTTPCISTTSEEGKIILNVLRER